MQIKTIVTFIVVTLGVLLGVGGMLWQFGNTEVKQITDIAGERRHVKGQGNVEVVEFSDLQCPACAQVQEPLKQILTKYEGKVSFVYRHFPLTNIHKNAMVAALASEAADKQGKFWEWHDLLFARQTEWAELADPKEKFGEYARELEMDVEKFETDMEGEEEKNIVSADLLAATRYRLTGTPSFFVNGYQVEFNQLEAKIAEFAQ